MAYTGDPKPADPSPSHDLTGKTVGRFVVRGKLGSGGMGEVYRAEDPVLKRSVAIKRVAPELASDAHYRRRFLKEAERASRLSNPHVAQIYDVLEEGSGIFLVMEFIEGETLRSRLTRPISLGDFMKAALQCAQALVAAHEKNIIHCDLKPENIMLTAAGDVKILDFGVARELTLPSRDSTTRSFDTAAGVLRGTPAYMAPEILLERTEDARVDIFSLGVVFYEALTGTHPFKAATFMATCDRILHESPPPPNKINPEVSEGLARIIMRMLAKNPDDRFANAQQLLGVLTAAAEAITHPSLLLRRVSELQRPRLMLSILAISIIAIGMVFIALLLGRKKENGASGGPAQQEELAVLPFHAVGGSPETAAFGDGLRETLTARLAQLASNHSVQIVPAGEVLAGQVKTAEEARQQFGANLVLEGSLERSGSMVRVTFSLVDPGTKRQLNAGTITAPAADPFAVEDEVVGEVAQMLSLNPVSGAATAAVSRGTRMPGAYDLYLEGLGYLQNYDRPENIEKAIGAFQSALQIDPNDASAYSGLGEAYLHRFGISNQTQWVSSAREACQKAEALDQKLATTHTCLGRVANVTGQYGSGAREFALALSQDPANDEAYQGLAFAQEHMGKTNEAESTFRRAISLRPQYWAGYNWLGNFYFNQGRYPEAAKAFAQAVALVPENFMSTSNLGGAYLLAGDYLKGIDALKRSIAIRPTYAALSNLGTAYYYLGQFDDSARSFKEALKLDQSDYMPWGNLGDAEFWVPGLRTQADQAYQMGIERGEALLKVNPNNASVLSSTGWFYARLGNPTKAFEYAHRAVRLSPKDPQVQLNMALVNIQFGQTVSGLDSIEKALEAGLTPKMVRDDPSFSSLKSNPRFQKLVQEH
jgi:tetratricopeptide (TPR) repeat protein/tRNA A-37 threonylcarbamoyl transferase component Bud32